MKKNFKIGEYISLNCYKINFPRSFYFPKLTHHPPDAPDPASPIYPHKRNPQKSRGGKWNDKWQWFFSLLLERGSSYPRLNSGGNIDRCLPPSSDRMHTFNLSVVWEGTRGPARTDLHSILLSSLPGRLHYSSSSYK